MLIDFVILQFGLGNSAEAHTSHRPALHPCLQPSPNDVGHAVSSQRDRRRCRRGPRGPRANGVGAAVCPPANAVLAEENAAPRRGRGRAGPRGGNDAAVAPRGTGAARDSARDGVAPPPRQVEGVGVRPAAVAGAGKKVASVSVARAAGSTAKSISPQKPVRRRAAAFCSPRCTSTATCLPRPFRCCRSTSP